MQQGDSIKKLNINNQTFEDVIIETYNKHFLSFKWKGSMRIFQTDRIQLAID